MVLILRVGRMRRAIEAGFLFPVSAESPYHPNGSLSLPIRCSASRRLAFYRLSLRSGLRAESRAPRSMPPEAFESSGCRRATGQFPPVLVDFSRSRERHQPSSRAIHASGQSDFRRVTANRTDQAATEDPGEGVSH